MQSAESTLGLYSANLPIRQNYIANGHVLPLAVAQCHYSVIKQIVELLLPVVFGFRALGRNATRAFHHFANLIDIAEIRLLLLHDIIVDRFAALEASGRIEVATSATASQIRVALRAGIVAEDLAGDAGRFPAAPTEEPFGWHDRCHVGNIMDKRIGCIGKVGGGQGVPKSGFDYAQPDLRRVLPTCGR